jgi:glycosyltransferase involved in cell wall biosynthesis
MNTASKEVSGARLLVLCPTFLPSQDGMSSIGQMVSSALTRAGAMVQVVSAVEPGQPDRSIERLFDDVPGWAESVPVVRGEAAASAINFKGDAVLCLGWNWWGTRFLTSLSSQSRRALFSHGYVHLGVLKPSARDFVRAVMRSGYIISTVRALGALDLLVTLSNSFERRIHGDRLLLARFRPELDRVTLPNPVSPRLLGSTGDSPDFRSERQLGEGEFLTIAVGNFTYQKDHLRLLRLFRSSEVPESRLVLFASVDNSIGREFRARVAGDPWLRARVSVEIGATQQLLFAAYRAADLYVSSARWEMQSLALLDAMASETPFLVPNVGNAPNSFGGECFANDREFIARYRALSASADRRAMLGGQALRQVKGLHDSAAWEADLLSIVGGLLRR